MRGEIRAACGSDSVAVIRIEYDPARVTGTFYFESDGDTGIWDRLKQSAAAKSDYAFRETSVELPWPSALSVIREFAPEQRRWRFRFRAIDDAKPLINRFVEDLKAVRHARAVRAEGLAVGEIERRLHGLGFRKRELRPFQIRDLQHLLTLCNGANFSVPGAGKTTVTFALHLLSRQDGQRLMVVAPKSAFGAWLEVVDDCISEAESSWVAEPFTVLTGGAEAVHRALYTGGMRFVINYEQLIAIPDLFSAFLGQNAVHLVLDESHRMKGGLNVKRGAILLSCSTMAVRRDILSGTPMPQSANDLRSQVDFLWPGAGLGSRPR